jgi:hypothetical protein
MKLLVVADDPPLQGALLRRMLRRDGRNKPEYHQFDALFSF